MGTPAAERPPLRAGVPIDSRRHTAAADEELLARASAAVRALARLQRRLPAVLHVMRDHQSGQPAAAAAPVGGADPDGQADRARLWCTTHERSLAGCEPDDLSCRIDPGRQISDHVGRAAVGHDMAAADMRAMRQLLHALVDSTVKMVAIADSYPTSTVELEKPDASDLVGTEWCRCCWKDDRYMEPITLRQSGPQAGRPYFTGLCLWCGRMRSTLGFEPPTWLVAMHHRGERINEGHLERARRERPAEAPAKPRKGKKRK